MGGLLADLGALGLLEGTPGLGQFVLHLAHAFLDSRRVGRGLQARRQGTDEIAAAAQMAEGAGPRQSLDAADIRADARLLRREVRADLPSRRDVGPAA